MPELTRTQRSALRALNAKSSDYVWYASEIGASVRTMETLVTLGLAEARRYKWATQYASTDKGLAMGVPRA